MAAVRRGQGPINLDLSPADLPPISALFLIHFDIKAGYTVTWKRSLAGITLDGVVEYKSLPSGLHTVKEDLVYFVHGEYAGLSAFVSAEAEEEQRNARMGAVGVLVPLSYGRLGRGWKHAEALKGIAIELIGDASKTKVLEEFWEKHKGQDTSSNVEAGDSLLDIPGSIYKLRTLGKAKGHGRNRSASDGAALLAPGHNLSAYHPAWSLLSLLEIFGPLIFPIHRAALLRKRILITAHAPVEQTCNFVYDLSVLSNIPLAVSDLLASDAPPQRLRPLFSIGVHDIPLLEEDLRASKAVSTPDSEPETRDEAGHGWIACTTDSILAMKSKLYDVLITMPPAYTQDATQKVWPKVESPQGVELRATQRDLRRYKALRWGLSHHKSPPASPNNTRSETLEPDTPRATSSHAHRDDPMLDIPDTDHIIEPVSWSALAYSGFMWWASAGEQRLQSEDEADADAALLSGLSLTPSTPVTPKTPRTPYLAAPRTEGTATQEMAIIAYFHRLTSQILTTLSDIVDVTDSDDEREDGDLLGEGEEDRGPSVYVSSADMERMGLDVWSAADHQFIEEIAREYFGRRAIVEGRTVDICGVRIC
ncbi:hypothetical protein B0O99DRAFT_622371 [Bisporella sp. PMI_857]|nr:hypothetical protein B0O99DRAFT_622371 [Bisporella sp. PMI_857]